VKPSRHWFALEEVTDIGAVREGTLKMPDDDLRPEILRGKGLLEAGDPGTARIVLEKCLPLAEAQQVSWMVVSVLGMLAACYSRLMRFDDAESTYNRAVQLANEKLEPDHVVRLSVIFSWAAYARSRGALEQEKRLWLTILPILESDPRWAGYLAECLRSLQELDTLAADERRLRESFEAARAADLSGEKSFAQRGASFQALQNSAEELAALVSNMGRHRECNAILRDGLIMRPEELWRRLTTLNAPFRQPVLDEQRCRFNLFLNHALRNPRPESAQTALETLLWRRGIAREIYRCANDLARRDPKVRSVLDTIRFNRANYAAMFFAAPPDTELRPAEKHRLKIELEPIERNFDYQELEAQLLERLEPQVNRFVSLPADCGELASKIPDDGLLVEYWRCTWPRDGEVVASYVALVLLKDRPDAASVVQLCDSAELEDTLREYLSLLSRRDKTAEFGNVKTVKPDPLRTRALGQRLRELVLDPLKPWTSRAKHLLVVADGLLDRLPFSALPLGDGYAMDQWLISYLDTARDLFGGDDSLAPPGSPIVISDPEYTWPGTIAKGDFRFDSLQCAAEEGEAIGNILGVEPLTSTGATKQALATCRSPEILHIATHGMILPVQPLIADLGPLNPLVWRDRGELRLHVDGLVVLTQNLGRLSGRQLPDQALRSILALSGVNTWLADGPLTDAAGNGLITAEDIAAMDLAGNRLTVLSACETGLGVIGIGEGVLGLRSSFTIAGTETLIVSLWSVDDVSTKDLMYEFYQNLLDKRMGRAEALQEAQNEIRKRYPDDPYYWAPFICQGAVEPLRR
jgi:CHAT domain-containing protein